MPSTCSERITPYSDLILFFACPVLTGTWGSIILFLFPDRLAALVPMVAGMLAAHDATCISDAARGEPRVIPA